MNNTLPEAETQSKATNSGLMLDTLPNNELKCGDCGAKFDYKCTLRYHKKTAHPTPVPLQKENSDKPDPKGLAPKGEEEREIKESEENKENNSDIFKDFRFQSTQKSYITDPKGLAPSGEEKEKNSDTTDPKGLAPDQEEEKEEPEEYDEFENFELFEYFGNVISRRKEVPITTPIEETLVSHNKLKVVFMNVNSLILPNKRIKATLGIQKSKADVVILAETKLNSRSQEFQVQGYYMAGQLTRKSGAGGLLVMAQKTIKIHSVVSKSILPEIQVITFVFNGYTFITVYRSLSLSVSSKVHHKTLIDYLSKQINKLKGEPYVLLGDFNLPILAANDFNPPIKINDFYADDFDEKNISVDHMWSDFFTEYHLYQWVTKPTYPRYNSILDLVITPIDQDICDLTVDEHLFGGSYDHYALVFQIDTDFTTDETQKTKRVKTKENWDKFLIYLVEQKIALEDQQKK